MVDTDQILLRRLTSLEDQAAWREFFDRYWVLVMHYAQRVGLSRTQAEDVLQETMIVLMRVMPRFEYNRERGRFRSYLKTVVQRLCGRVRLSGTRDGDRVNFDTMPESARRDPALTAAEELERRDDDGELWEQSLFAAAVQAVFADPRIDERTQAVFRAYVLENEPVAAVARRFGVEPNAVYQIKNRLLKRVRKEVARLERDLGR